jgi:serine/threonine-protein kinase
MNSPTSPTLRDLYEAARALPPDRRDRYIDTHCDDTATRDRIRRMLAVHAAALESMPATPAEVLARALGDPEDSPAISVGARIGPFTLNRVLGEGGSSTVFRADRDSDGVRQVVALKILHRSLHSPEARRQFRRERQALTQLQHPGIARLIEGGIGETGTAYIALELVEGKPITQYALERKLDLRSRLELFLQVCRAVEAAHRALIVHRDLKPSNVLVTDEGTVKLLDFGIAKLLVTEDDTQTHLPSFTPAYAAPEQRGGAPITTATDVYALGVLLGELLTGKRLNDGSDRTPSSRLTDAIADDITRRALRGDLDNIVVKAISVEPDRRYASAGAFADDIERYLAGRPVGAHPPSRRYRMGKFVRRHSAAVATVSVLLVVILISLGAAVWEARDARLGAERARTEAAKAKQTAAFLSAMLTGIDPDRAKTMDRSLIRLMLDSAAANAERSLSGAPEVRASIEQSIGDAYYSIGEYELADTHFVDALQAANAAHLDIAAQVRLTARRLDALNQFGRYTEASQLADWIKQAVTALPESDADRLFAETSVGIHECTLFRREPCRERLTRVYDIARKTLGDDAPLTLHAAAGIVVSDFAPERYAEGKALAQNLYTRYAALYGVDDSRTMEMAKAIAINSENLGEFADAERVLAENLPRAQRAFGEQHPITANFTFWMGNVLRREGRFAEAKPLLQRALELNRRVKGENSFDTLSTETSLAQVLAELHDDAAAEPLARDLAERMQALPHGDHGASAGLLAMILIDEKRYAEAERELDSAYAAFTKTRTHSEDEPAVLARDYVQLYTAWGKPDLAQHWRERLPARLNSE